VNGGAFVAVWLALALVGGAVGYAIGNNKGQGAVGFWLGLLLGFVGWIVVAVMEPSEEIRAERNAELASAFAAGGTLPFGMTTASSGWYPDPFSRHQYRYFDGRGWTEHVSNQGSASTDQLPLSPRSAEPGSQVTAGWFPDPFGRHGHRYWNGKDWTESVGDNGVAGVDGAPLRPAGLDAPHGGSTRPCPWCAEDIKRAAKVCRYCQREVAPLDGAG
jgi:hypothetical protein